MTYHVEDGIHTIQCSPKEFSLVLVDERKKKIEKTTYTNANFFGNYSKQGESFTLPAGHLIADYEAQSKWELHYCKERGKFIGDKFYFDAGKWTVDKQFYGKSLSTLIVENGKARIEEVKNLKDSYAYAVSGVPVMRNSQDVKFYGDVTCQGYDGSTLYATKHIFVGLKPNDDRIYIMGYKTTTSNLVYSAEMFKKLSKLGYSDVIKLDGGGSYHFEVNNKVVDTMSENRRISAVICVNSIEEEDKLKINEPSSWAEEAWDKAYKKGCLDGTNPSGTVTREMLSVVLDSLKLL